MNKYIVGSGKLATAILEAGLTFQSGKMLKWDTQYRTSEQPSILVHAGSGRQLPECFEYCTRTKSVLIELSTGMETETMEPDFPLVICPNTSILLLKTLSLFKANGQSFAGYEISITESHQSTKITEAGTAYAFAESLNFPVANIRSVRDPEVQRNVLGIPEEYLGRHAYHKIVIKDGKDQISFETKVLGHSSYAQGVQRIVEAAMNNTLENKKYSVLDLVEHGML